MILDSAQSLSRITKTYELPVYGSLDQLSVIISRFSREENARYRYLSCVPKITLSLTGFLNPELERGRPELVHF